MRNLIVRSFLLFIFLLLSCSSCNRLHHPSLSIDRSHRDIVRGYRGILIYSHDLLTLPDVPLQMGHSQIHEIIPAIRFTARPIDNLTALEIVCRRCAMAYYYRLIILVKSPLQYGVYSWNSVC